MVGCWDCDNEPDFTAQRREWARELQSCRLQLARAVPALETPVFPAPRYFNLALEKLKRIQDEIYDLSEGQGQ